MTLPYNLMDAVSSLKDHGAIIVSDATAGLWKQHNTLSGEKKHGVVLAAIMVLISSYAISKRLLRKRRSDSEVMPVSGGVPYLGHFLELYRNPSALISRGKTEQGPAFRIRLPHQDVYVLTGALIEEMFHSPRVFNAYQGFERLMPLDQALRISYGHKLKVEQLGPRDKDPVSWTVKESFKPYQITMFSERMQQGLSQALAMKLDLNPGERRILYPREITSIAIAQITCLCLAGSNLERSQELASAMTAGFSRNVFRTGLAFSFLPSWIAEWITRRYFSLENVLDLVMDILVPELEKIRAGRKAGLEDSEPTILSMMLNMPKSNGALRTPQEAALYFIKAAMGSIHGPSSFLSFALYELACRPGVVNELRAEIEKLEERTPDTVGQIRLLDSIFREVLRCKTPKLKMLHKTLQDAVLSTNHVIPRGSLVIGALQDAHMDPAVMHKTASLGAQLPLDEFDPYRYMHAQESDSSMCSTSIGSELLTFGLSAHACPGRYFAAQEIKYIVAELFMQYDITTKSGGRLDDVDAFGLFRSPPPDPLVFERRG